MCLTEEHNADRWFHSLHSQLSFPTEKVVKFIDMTEAHSQHFLTFSLFSYSFTANNFPLDLRWERNTLQCRDLAIIPRLSYFAAEKSVNKEKT